MPNQISPSSTPYEVLYNHVRKWKYCDVLIDRMAGFPFQEEIEALGEQDVHQFLLNDPIFAESPEQGPLLVRLPWTQVELIEKCLTCALQEATDPEVQTRTICTFLFSTLDQASLGKLLTKRLDVPVHTVGNIYFRYFDPRVVRHLPRILDKSQLSGLFHGVQAWFYVGWEGQLDVIAPELLDTVARFSLTAAQWRQMEGIEPFNVALRVLQQSGFLDEAPEAHVETCLLAAVRDAAIAGLTAPEDQAAFAACAVRFGKDFTQHPRLAEAIRSATQHGSPLADALEAYTGITPASISLPQIPDQRATT